jgi:hypothetical protein
MSVRRRLPTPRFGGKKFKIEMDSSIWREEKLGPADGRRSTIDNRQSTIDNRRSDSEEFDDGRRNQEVDAVGRNYCRPYIVIPSEIDTDTSSIDLYSDIRRQ